MMEQIPEYDCMLAPICATCCEEVEFVVGEADSVTSKCGCKEGFMLRQQWLLLEYQDDEFDRSLLMNFLRVSQAMTPVDVHYMIRDFKTLHFNGLDTSSIDRNDALFELLRVKCELDQSKLI